MTNEKLFRYSIRSKKSGKLIAQEIVAFGNEEYPFPEHYETDTRFQMALQDYRETMFEKYLEIIIDDKTELSDDEEGLK